jgi:TPR repeat protein
MRTRKRFFALAFAGAGLATASAAWSLDAVRTPAAVPVGPVLALDGTPAPPNSRAPTPLTPVEAFRSGARALKAGEMSKAVTSLEYAAEQGHTAAQWKLGRMYADGEGVKQNDLRAFQYFSRIAKSHADDSPEAPQSRYVANAFVALGNYYLTGIAGTPLTPDAERAREMFSYAASYFADPDAQYHLARLYLDGKGAPRDPRQAARWLLLAANKGQYHAQAVLGHMLFKGEFVPRQGARGLMWLTLAREGAMGDEKWIVDLYDAAVQLATPDERQTAVTYLERHMRGRQD